MFALVDARVEGSIEGVRNGATSGVTGGLVVGGGRFVVEGVRCVGMLALGAGVTGMVVIVRVFGGGGARRRAVAVHFGGVGLGLVL